MANERQTIIHSSLGSVFSVFSEEELKEFLKIESQLRSVTEEMGQKWILGVSNVEEDWNGYIQRLNDLGLKRAQEIQKTAYDRFMKN